MCDTKLELYITYKKMNFVLNLGKNLRILIKWIFHILLIYVSDTAT